MNLNGQQVQGKKIIRELQIKLHRHLKPLQWQFSKHKITSLEKNIVNTRTLFIALDNGKWCSFCGRWFGSSSKSEKNYHMTQHFHSWVYKPPQKNLQLVQIHVLQHFSQEPKGGSQMFTRWWINKLQSKHRMKCFSAIKIVLLHTTSMGLENSMQCKRGQRQNATYCMILFKCNIKNSQIHRDKKQINDCQSLGGKNEKWLVSVLEVSFWGDENVPEILSGDG